MGNRYWRLLISNDYNSHAMFQKNYPQLQKIFLKKRKGFHLVFIIIINSKIRLRMGIEYKLWVFQ